MAAGLQSSVSPEDWAPVHDALLRAVVHSANNRVAALGGIVQLQDHRLATPTEGIASLRDEMTRLRTLMERFRDLTVRPGEQRVTVRFSDALRSAQRVLGHASVSRNWQVTLADEAEGVAPVQLWPADPFRFAVLLLMAAGTGVGSGEFFTAVLSSGERTETSVVSPAKADEVRASTHFAALERAAALEGGSLRCEATATGTELTLSLPAAAPPPEDE